MMSDKETTNSRRKLLKSIAAGSSVVVAGKSLPESWSKPVVDSIVLSAHAQTTQTSCQVCFSVQATITGSWTGNRRIIIADQMCSEPPIFEQKVDWSAGVFDEQLCTNLEPGIYTIDFDAGAGADSGAGSIEIAGQLECCGNVLWSDSQSESGSSGGGEGIGECGTLTIAPDGTCNFDDTGSCCFLD